jgi:NTE family protein
LKVFEEERIPVGLIAGSSMGALVGAAYAAGIGAAELESLVVSYLETPEFQSSAIRAMEKAGQTDGITVARKIQNFFANAFYLLQAMFRPGIMSVDEFQRMIDFFVPDILIEQTRIPWFGVAADLVSGEEVVFSEGSLRKAVMASCAVPGAIEPLKDGERLLSDGGIVSLAPTRAARRHGADTIVAVVVEKNIALRDELLTGRDVSARATEVMSRRLVDHDLRDADIVIRPDVADLDWAEFSQALHLVDAGAHATREKLAEIRRRTSGWRRWLPMRGILGDILRR